MICELGNEELFELCENNSKSAMLYFVGIKEYYLLHLRTILG